MGYRYTSPFIKIFGFRIHRNKKGFSIQRKGIFGQRKTYNTATGKTTTTYKTGIPGLSYRKITGGQKLNDKNGLAQETYYKTLKNIKKGSNFSVDNGNLFLTNEGKEFIVTLLTGIFGTHKFMQGKFGLGFLYFFTFGFFGIGWIKDCIKSASNLKKLIK